VEVSLAVQEPVEIGNYLPLLVCKEGLVVSRL